MYKLIIEQDEVTKTFSYQINNVDTNETILFGDSFINKDAIIVDLSEINEALSSIFG